ncbi:MAG: LrgB family protein [Fulvimarina manganoxydans]|uniref:LrgB family protein n=1 Tax=Fulvimarina manganoxydans TaxID=937218 RepID=UPI002356DFAB|nr:LrgB family protein [Fulvimarina manganoxydans]MCK5932853.1 LrgB family protein [Fulvimarina manganoxydans]
MGETIVDIWVYLAASPLLSLTMTLLAFELGQRFWKRIGRPALLNPVLVTVVLIASVLIATGTSYETYFEGAQFIHFLLGPATVCLAIPLYRQFERVKTNALAIAVSLVMGSATGILGAIGAALVMGLDSVSVLSIAPKSVTAPVAMGITEKLGGLPSLTAVFVIMTGIIGAALGPLVLNGLRVKPAPARGYALGTGAHGIGTAQALQDSEVAGAFAGLAMGLNALATALFAPIIVAILL